MTRAFGVWLIVATLMAAREGAAAQPTAISHATRAGTVASQSGRVARYRSAGASFMPDARRPQGIARKTRHAARAAKAAPVYIDLGAAQEFAYHDMVNFSDRLFVVEANNVETNTVEVDFDFGVGADAPNYFDLLWCSLRTLSGDFLFDFSTLSIDERAVYQDSTQFLSVTHLAVVEEVICAGNLGFDDGSQTYYAPPTVYGSYLPYSATDFDGDEVADSADNCVTDYNPDQADSDGDQLGDACDLRLHDPHFIGEDRGYFDDDFDGIADHDTNGALLPADTVVGSDDFGNQYYADNCPDVFNPLQWDTDLDGIGDDCDSDYAFLQSVSGAALGNAGDLAGRTVDISDYTHSIRLRAAADLVIDSCDVTYFDEAQQDYFVLTYDFRAAASDGSYDVAGDTSEYLTLDQDLYVSEVSCLAAAPTLGIDFYYKPGVAPLSCTGDCNADGQVTIDELIRGVNIALGSQELASCPAFDASADNQVSIDELIQAVNSSLAGCSL